MKAIDLNIYEMTGAPSLHLVFTASTHFHSSYALERV